MRPQPRMGTVDEHQRRVHPPAHVWRRVQSACEHCLKASYSRCQRAHQVIQTRASSTLRKWGTQDFNLAMLAIQQGGPRERIPYPRPLEYAA
jgi:hypothetical protein